MTGNDLSKTPTVSIIVPAFNASKYIGSALKSIFQQTYTDYEVLIVNDGSSDTDALELALSPYSNRIIYLEQENSGPSAARNRALRVARGRFIALLDADDIWEPEYLSVQMSVMSENTSVDVLYSDALLFGDPLYNKKTFMQVCPSAGEVTLSRLIKEECAVMISVLARRAPLFAVGLFDESLRRCEDFDLWLRLVKAGYQIAYHRRVLLRYRKHSGSSSANTLLMYKGRLQVFDKLAQFGGLSAAETEALNQARGKCLANISLCEGKDALSEGDFATAIKKFSKANSLVRSYKLGLVLQLLRVAPKLLLFAYNFRNRLRE